MMRLWFMFLLLLVIIVVSLVEGDIFSKMLIETESGLVNPGYILSVLRQATINPTQAELMEHFLHGCAEKNLPRTMRLLSSAIDGDLEVINVRHEMYGTPLDTAANMGSIDIVKLLLELGVSPWDEPRSSQMPTPLDRATLSGRLDIVKFLLEDKVEGKKESRNRYKRIGMTLQMFCQNMLDYPQILKLLLSSTNKSILNYMTEDGNGLFHILFSITTGEKEANVRDRIAKELMLAGADINMPNYGSRSWDTALHIVSQRGDVMAVKQLLSYEGLNVNVQNSKGYTAVYVALRLGVLEIARVLLDSPLVDLDIKCIKGKTVLHELAQEGPRVESSIKLVLNYSLEGLESPRDATGATPLLIAAQEGWITIVELFIEKGANVFSKNFQGATALILSSREGKLDVVSKLLEIDADLVYEETKSGHTALHACSAEGYQDVCRLLLENTFRKVELIQKKTRAGLKAIDIARIQGQTFVVDLLMEYYEKLNLLEECQDLNKIQNSQCSSINDYTDLELDFTMNNKDLFPFRTSSINDYPDLELDFTISNNDLWPWSTTQPDSINLLGQVKVGFKQDFIKDVKTEVKSLHSLPILSIDYNNYESIPRWVQAAGIPTSFHLAQSARSFLNTSQYLQRQLSNHTKLSSVHFWASYYPFDVIKGKTRKETDVVRKSLLTQFLNAFSTFKKNAIPKIANVLRCTSNSTVRQKLVCPDFGVSLRLISDQHFGQTHLDFPSKIELLFNKKHGRTRDDWWNVWFLLSESTFDDPLVLFDPTVLEKDVEGYLPPKNIPNWRSFTFHNMRPGDTMIWRTTKVPHSAGKLIRPKDWKGWDDTLSAYQVRRSIDFRCVCIRS